MRHAASFVLDEADQPVYAWRDGARAGERQAAAFLRETAPLVAKVREVETLRGAARNRGIGGSITRTGVISVGGELYLAAVTNIVPETPAINSRGAPDRLLISARRIDAALLQDIAQAMRVSDVRLLAWNRAIPASVQLHGPDGTPIAAVAWTSSHPGDAVLRQIAPLFALGMVALLISALLLAARVHRVFGEIDRNDLVLRQTMEDLVRARDEAAAASIAKSQFVANMSHEIRTPLNGILGMTQILSREDLTPDQRRQLDVVRESGQTLLVLLNDILDMSKIEAERYELAREAFDGREAVSSVLRLMRGQADRAGVQLRGLLPREPLDVLADRRALKQIALNLISNALKFTPRGGAVTVTLQADGAVMELLVADTGVGIGPEDLQRLGRPFEQAGGAAQRAAGTGLGLSLVRSFAQLHGGEMIIESRMGEGTTVSVRLPVLDQPAAANAP